MIDDVLRANILPSIDWVRNIPPIASLQDLAFGYAIGTLERMASDTVIVKSRGKITEEDDNEIRTMLRRRLPDIMEKINRELSR